MSAARRRDEWERWSRLLALLDARTDWSENASPKRPLDWWPEDLIPPEFHRAAPPVPPTTFAPPRPDTYDRLKGLARNR